MNRYEVKRGKFLGSTGSKTQPDNTNLHFVMLVDHETGNTWYLGSGDTADEALTEARKFWINVATMLRSA